MLAHNIYKPIRLKNDYLTFLHLYSECKKLRKIDYLKYTENSENNIETNPKQFWTFFKQKKLINDLPNYISLNSDHADNGQDIVNLFAKNFSNTISILSR